MPRDRSVNSNLPANPGQCAIPHLNSTVSVTVHVLSNDVCMLSRIADKTCLTAIMKSSSYHAGFHPSFLIPHAGFQCQWLTLYRNPHTGT